MKKQEDSITPLNEAFSKFLREKNLSSKFLRKKMEIEWERIVGKTVAKYTEKIFFKKKELYIKFNSSSLRQEMIYQQEDFLLRINEELDKDAMIDRIIFL